MQMETLLVDTAKNLIKENTQNNEKPFIQIKKPRQKTDLMLIGNHINQTKKILKRNLERKLKTKEK
jgi:glucose-6-phosphate isomerase